MLSGKNPRLGLPPDVLEYLEVPLRRPWHAIVPFVLIVCAAVAASFVLPKKYRSSTLILVESEKVPDAFVQKMVTEASTKRLLTIKQEILSRTRLETVISELHPYSYIGPESLTSSVERMRSAIDITVKGSDAFSIDYIHRDPELAMNVANRLASLFIEEAARSRSEQVSEAYDFIEAQLVDSRRELEAREGALRQYKEQHMGTLPEQMVANLSTLQRLQGEQQTVSESLRAATERLIQVENNPSRAAGPGINAELAQLQGQLSSLRSRYTDEHPDVRAVKARIASLERQEAENVQNAPTTQDTGVLAGRVQIEQARHEVEKLRTRLGDVEAQIATFQARVEQAPRTEAEISTLSRDFQKLNENYLTLLNKKMEAKMAAKLEHRWKGEQFRILDPANLPERAFFPNRMLFTVMGVLLGLGVGLGVAVAAHFLDHSIKSVRELEGLLPYPVLAVLPSFQGLQNVRRSGTPFDPGIRPDDMDSEAVDIASPRSL